MHTTTKINAIILLIFLMASLLAGTPTAFSQEGSLPDKVMKFTGDANWPPYQFLNEAGEPDGFCVDLVRALCQEQNLRCEFELYQDWAQAQQAVADGLADAVLGFGKTTEREKLFDFSETIATIREVIAVREETLTVHSLEDLYGTSVAAVSGTPDYLQLSEDPRFHVIPVRGEAEGLRKLANREAKAFISDELAIRYVVQLREIEGLKIVGSPIWEMEVVIGVTKGKHELLEMVNAGLSSLKEGGTTDEITTKWFGSEIRPQRFPSWIRWAATVGLSIGTLIGLAALGLLVFNRRLAEEVKGRTAALEQEVHERKRAEEALRQSEYLLRQVLDTNPAVIFVKDYDSRVLLANKTMAEFYNLSVEEVTGRLQSDLHRQHGADPKDIDKWLADDRKVIDTGRPEYLVESGTDSQNRPLWFQTRKYPIDIGPDRRGVLVISEDITERKRAEEALRESEQNFRDLAENLLDGIAIIDENEQYIYVNPEFTEITGYSADELMGMTGWDLTRSEDLAKFKRRMKKRLGGEAHAREYERFLVRKDGTEVLTEMSTTTTVWQGEERTLAITRDITERKRAEKELRKYREYLEELVAERTAELNERVAEVEQLNRGMGNMLEDLQSANRATQRIAHRLQEANAELEAFAYSVSHDLRAPLRAISGFGQIIARRYRDSLPEEGQHYFDNIIEASGHMGRLIDDLLRYSRLGRRAVRRRPVPLNDVLDRVTGDLASRMAESQAQIKIADDLPTVRGDETLLSQIFTNLLDNALTYHRAGVPPEIVVNYEEDADHVIVSVADSGIGIAPEFHDKIFNIFQRLHSQDEYPGTGIGLSIVKKAAEMLSGRVWMESAEGEGTTFYVQLPAASEQ